MKKLFTALFIAFVSQVSAQAKTLKKDTATINIQKTGCDPVARLGKYTGNCYIPIKEIKIARAVFVKTCNKDDGLFQVETFEITIMGGDKKFASYPTSGNKFSEEIVNELQKVKQGQKIFIENVKCKSPDGSIKSISGITIIVK